MHRGYANLWRKTKTSPVWQMPPLYFRVWAWMLMSVNYETRTIPTPSGPVEVLSGQRITSLRQIAEEVAWYEFGVIKTPNVKTIKTVLDWLEGNRQCTVESNTKGTLITVTNWSSYNEKPSKKTVESNAEGTAGSNTERILTIKNHKKKKNLSGKIPTGDHHFFIAWWNMAFQKVTGHKPMINGRTGKQVQNMLSSGISIKHLICYGAIVLTSDDDFYQKAGRTLAVLEGQLDSFKSKRNEYDIEYWRELGIMPPVGVELCNWNFMEANSETEATV